MANNKSKKDSILFTFVGHGQFLHSGDRKLDRSEGKFNGDNWVNHSNDMVKLWVNLFNNIKIHVENKVEKDKTVYLGFDGDPPGSPPAVLVHFLYSLLKDKGVDVKIVQVQVQRPSGEWDDTSGCCNMLPCSFCSFNTYHIYATPSKLGTFIEKIKKDKFRLIEKDDLISLPYKVNKDKKAEHPPKFEDGIFTVTDYGQDWGGFKNGKPVCSTEIWNDIEKWGINFNLPTAVENRHAIFFWDPKINEGLGKGKVNDIQEDNSISGQTYKYFAKQDPKKYVVSAFTTDGFYIHKAKPTEKNHVVGEENPFSEAMSKVPMASMYGGARKSKSKRSRRKQKSGKSRRRSKNKKSLRKRRTRRRR